jgi:hypothetical protein
VAQAFDGQNVMAHVIAEEPIAVLMQMDLVGSVRCRELLAGLHANPQTSNTPVLVFSWQGDGDWGNEWGAICLSEPVTYAGFVNALHAAGVVLPHEPINHSEPVLPGVRRRKDKK